MLATNFSNGSLNQKQSFRLKDVVKFHGHLCDGLKVGFLEAKEALSKFTFR
ncbi:MAG: hypothetical protein ABWZ56_01000 [Flavobacterium sp.]